MSMGTAMSGGCSNKHTPPIQVSQPVTIRQSRPHIRQFRGSENRFVHEPLQQISGSAQGAAHSPSQTPALQALPAAHSFPHMPQFFGSSTRLLQPDVQHVWLLRHDSPAGPHLHDPPSQRSPDTQVLPQPPQFTLSAITSRQPSVQHCVPAPHAWSRPPPRHTHALFAQTSREPQTFPQVPQLSGLVLVSTQGSPLQHTPAGFSHLTASQLSPASSMGLAMSLVRFGVIAWSGLHPPSSPDRASPPTSITSARAQVR